jgi:hypothetical protein
VLVPGAGGPVGTGAASPPSSTRAGHHARPVGLPGDGNTAGLARYVDTICGITATEPDTVLVAP